MTNTAHHPARAAFVKLCEGHAYMLSVGALVLFGHLFHLEFWFNIVHMLLLSAALCLSNSVKPLAVSNLIFIFQVTLKHSPSAPHFSTYYFEGANLWIVAALVVILLAALISYLVRTEFFSHVRFGKTPLLLPLVLFSATLLTNGLFFDRYTVSNLTFAAVQVAVYLVDFLVLWDGLRRIEPAELMTLAVDLSVMVSWILAIELANVYLVSVTAGLLDKREIMFGWGISNSCACCLSIQLPVMFYGVFSGKRRVLASVTGLVACFALVCTLSRSAIAFSAVILLLCFLYACLFGPQRKAFRKIALFAVLIVAILFVSLYLAFPEKAETVLDYFRRTGFGDGGRFSIWREALANFKEGPIFGVGFYGRRVLNSDTLGDVYTDFYPEFAHNTLIEMLTSVGVLGLAAYLFMRVRSLAVFIKRPSSEKVFLGFSVLIFLLESQLDIFTFSIYPTFFYNFALAAAFALDQHAKEKDAEPTDVGA